MTVLVRDGAEVVEADADVLVVPGVSSGLTRVRSEWTRLPRLVRSLQADVFVNPNEAVPPGVDAPLVVVAQNLLYHCRQAGPLPTGPLSARLRSRAQFAFYRRQMPRAYARARVVVAVSRQAAELLADRAALDLGRVRIVACGADRLPVLPRSSESAAKMLLAVGAIAHYKRLDLAVRALAALVGSGGDYRLLLVGDEWPGAWRPLAALARDLGVGERVERVGIVGDAELAALYARAFAAVATSACESFGIPVAEAMRAGLPVVAADEPWSRELAERAAVLTAAQPEAIAEGIRALQDDGVWHERSEAGRRLSAAYTWAGTASGIAAAARDAAGAS